MTTNHAPLTTAILLLSPALALAKNIPTVLGYLTNQDQGQIVFTLSQGSCKPSQFFVFGTSKEGEVKLAGCYERFGDQLVTIWNDEETPYAYNINNITLSTETKRYLNIQ
jgi:hypothetical protein